MKYDLDYLENEFGIFKIDEDCYDIAIGRVYTDDVNKDYVEENKALDLDLHLLNLLNIENGITIYLDYVEEVYDNWYIGSLNVYDDNDGYISLLFDGNPFEYESVEIICNTVANYLKEHNVCASVEFREFVDEEYIEGFIDYCLSK